MEPLVTVVMCVKNVEDTVKDAVDSVLLQDYPHDRMELIIVDGSSVDKTLLIVEKALADTNIGSRFFSECKGLGFARQIAVNFSLGEYIIWVDGDIVLSKDYVTRQVDFMERNPEVGIAGGRFGELRNGTLPAALENLVYVVTSSVQIGKIKSRLLTRNGEEHRFIGTEGSIYRVEAVRRVKGFDIKIKGAAEDVDLAYRIKLAGWKLRRTDATFYESCRESWKDLWNQYVWYGYGGYYLTQKDRKAIPLAEMLPPIGFLAGLLYSISAYELTGRKVSFLLPLHYLFKRIAWCFGFIKGRMEHYGALQT
jgi:glycosyltransferase involved in cell wall biosynthesis